MPVRGSGGQDKRWALSWRWLPNIPVDRAEQRFTATYTAAPGLRVGLEYNPLDDDLGPLVNWRVLEETVRRPMLMIGTSSDRIGTPDGRAYYATLSKDLEHYTGLPVAPYAGTAYGEYANELELIGGMSIRWREDTVSTHVWDGHNLHHMLDRYLDGGYRVGLVVAQQGDSLYAGLSVGVGF